MDTFPKGFLWGASTSAYQVEGGNSFSDWWGWEKRAGLTESGEACRHYHLYREDFETAAALSHNCHRLSLEWGRIEPVKGGYSGEAISHYRQVIRSLKELGLEPVVTLNHFTLPQWFAQEGGWLAPGAPGSFLRYVERMVRELGGEVRYWVTLNEPMVFIYHGYVLGIWPPQERSLLRALRAGQRLAAVHARAYRLIHRLYAAGGLGKAQVSIAHNMQAFVTCTPSLKNKAAASLRDRLFNFWFLDRLMRMRTLDFIGLNYYTRGLVDVRGWGIRHLLLDFCAQGHHPLPKNELGWDIYPQGLHRSLTGLWQRYRLPVFILENGICTRDDSLRWEYIREHLLYVLRAMQEGVKVIGYLHWSLMDNFEWDKGFGPRFGLIEVDYATFSRKVRDSAVKFAQVIRSGRL